MLIDLMYASTANNYVRCVFLQVQVVVKLVKKSISVPLIDLAIEIVLSVQNGRSIAVNVIPQL